MKRGKFFLLAVMILSLLTLIGCDTYKGLYGGDNKDIGDIPSLERLVSDETSPKGKISLNTKEGTAQLEVANLPVLNSSQNYEIWLYDKETDSMVTLGTFKVNSNGSAGISAKAEPADITDSEQVIITLEEYPVEEPDPSGIEILKGNIGVQADVIEVKLFRAAGFKIEKKVVMSSDTDASEKQEVLGEGEAIVIVAEETELVKISPEAEDADNDKLQYFYTSPFDENGEWQTNYGDANQYDVTVTVSDGADSTSKKVLIILNKKEVAPEIKEFSPSSESVAANEDSTLEFSVTAEDVNNDELSYSWKVDDTEKALSDSFSYQLGFDDAGQHKVVTVVSDGKLETSKQWNVDVSNVNRKPVIEGIGDITIKETEAVRITPTASDPDNDAITLKISEPVGDDGVWETNYDSAGRYKVTVSASDGTDTVSQDITVTVENANRPPVIKNIVKR